MRNYDLIHNTQHSSKRDGPETTLARQLFSLALLVVGITVAPEANGSSFPTGKACIPAWSTIPNSADIDSSTLSSTRGGDGYLYLGGREGLYRVEGGRVRGWFPEIDTPGSLPAGYVRALAPGPGGLWVGTQGGLSWFDYRTEQFEPVPFGDTEITNTQIYDIQLHDGLLYVGYDTGGAVVEPESRQLVGEFESGGRGSDARIYDLDVFRDKVIAVSGARPILVEPDASTSLLLDNGGEEIAVRGYEAAIAPDGALWMTNRGSQLLRVPADPAQNHQFYSRSDLAGLPEGTLQALGFDPDGNLWIASNSALAKWRQGDVQPTPCRSSPVSQSERPVAVSVFDGRSGPFLLVGSLNQSALLTRETPAVRRIVNGESFNPGLPESPIWSLLLDPDGRIVVGTLSGLFRETTQGSDAFEAIAPQQLEDKRVYALKLGPNGKLWVGTNRGLYVVDGDDSRQVPMVTFDNGNPTSDLTYYIDVIGEQVAVATSRGIVLIDSDTETVDFLFRSDEGTRAVNDAPFVDTGTPRFWHVDAVGNELYGVGDDGLYRFDVDKGEIAASTVDARKTGRLQPGKLYASAATTDGRVFLAYDAGVIETDRDFEFFRYIDNIDGERFGSQLAAEQAPDGSIWFGGHLGVVRYVPAEDDWTVHTVKDGLHSDEVTQNAMAVTPEGFIMSANGSGLSLMDPSGLGQRAPASPQLAHVESGGAILPVQGDAVTLGPVDRDLSLDFAVPELDTGRRASIAFTFGTDVQPGPEQRLDFRERLTFPRLEPGNYVFEGRTVEPGRGVSSIVRYDVTVLPYWWETRLAQAVGLIILLFLLASVFVWRMRRVTRRYRLIGDERRRIAQDFHDTFMQEVFGALMLGRQLESADPDDDKASKLVCLLESASRSARASVNELSDTRENAPLGQALANHDPTRIMDGDSDIIRVEELGTPWDISEERAFFVSRAAKEAMTNAVKHARASSIKVTIDWQAWSLKIRVVDNGKGFDPVAVSDTESFGLQAMERLTRAARGRFEVNSSPNDGTVVEITARRFGL